MNEFSTLIYYLDTRFAESGYVFNPSDLLNWDFAEDEEVFKLLDLLETSPSDELINQILEKSRNL
ncbi:MAG: hypothetical protein K9I34_01685 [Bacteroidales bacterium]|nr:hypothetical protein [Bacteroidales bacterium]